MVYNGKPSPACLPCGRRKLRCDLKKAFCGQCLRAGLACSGYRDPSALRIQDETQEARQRTLGLKVERVPRFGELSLLQRARDSFFRHYVHGLVKSYDVIELLSKGQQLEQHVDKSIDAVSLAFFHFQLASTPVSLTARKAYLSALRLVNAALRDPIAYTSDSTLMAVLLLDLFEKITSNGPISSEAWLSHVYGGLALVKLRGPVQFQTIIGLRPELIRLRLDLRPYVDVEDPKWKASNLSVKLAQFRVVLKKSNLSDAEIIERANSLDSEFSSLLANLPVSWLPRRRYLQSPSSRVLSRFYDIYPDCFTPQSCNVARMNRIMLNVVIRAARQKSLGDTQTPSINEVYSGSVDRIVDEMADDICASGPQFTGVGDSPTDYGHDSPLRSLFCYTLILPYYIAALYASPESKVKAWIVDQLHFMSDEFRIRNARVVAEILAANENMDPWAVYAMLGGYAFAI